MKKIFIFKLLISIFVVFCLSSKCFAENTFVSLSPALTEIMYALGAQNLLEGVSSECKIPFGEKEIIGNNFFVNTEKIIKIKPTYILAFDTSEIILNKFKNFNIKPLCLKYPDIESIYKNILFLGNLTNKRSNAEKLVNLSKEKITKIQNKNPQKILYLVQTEPMITIGNKSFISDVIKKSGQISITRNINSYYPVISEEYCVKQKPDVIVIGLYANKNRVEKMFKNSKIVVLTKEQNDIINRPNHKIHEAVELFAKM